MTSADVMRFVIIVSLGVISFITFLVAGTILGLMWVESWSCGSCKQYPVGLYILALLGILLLVSIGMEASDAPEPWQKWVRANWVTIVVIFASFLAFWLVINWWWF